MHSQATAPPSPSTLVGLSGADIVLRVLEAAGVEHCFGMPGGAILPIYDALARGSSIRHVLVRHEQGAGHMAQGYARASGGPGVVFATSGPGATNLVTPIADAQLDSTPLVCITGQVRTALIGTDAFQECDIVGVTMPLVKHSWQVRDVVDLPGVLEEALALAQTGRPGPVLVDIPRDVQEAVLQQPPLHRVRRVVDPAPSSEQTAIESAVQAIAIADRPVLYLGGGAQCCSPAARVFAEKAGLPVVATLMGKGAFPENHALFVGWPGMHGTKTANWALYHADLIVAAGARFDDRVTGRVDAFAPGARVIHIDVDAYEHNKIRRADIALHGELGAVLAELSAEMPTAKRDRSDWLAQLDGWKQRFPLGHPPRSADGPLKPQEVIQFLSRSAAALDDVIWTTGVGQHQMWAMQYVQVQSPRSFISSGGLGTMGFGLPAAIGARAARPDATVICVDGDGSFQMTLQELATAVDEDLPVVVAILNNGVLGMVHQWQTMFYEERLSASHLPPGARSLAKIAAGFGALGFDVRTMDELAFAVDASLRSRRPAVLDIHVDGAEACFPMIVPGGAAADQVEWHERVP